MSIFESLNLLPDDPILSIPILFNRDSNAKKVNLGIGTYRTEEGKPWVLPSVHETEKLLLDQNLNKEYLPIEGDKEYLHQVEQLVLSETLAKSVEKRLFSAQTLGGSGALHVGAKLIAQARPESKIYVPSPTWANHLLIFKKAGLQVEPYPYYDPLHHKLDFEGMCGFFNALPVGSVILLHGCCHNPTGMDPSAEQWKELSQIFHTKRLIPFFDLAYLGFGQNLELDADPIRLFLQSIPEMLIATSFSKNFGLYGERVGALTLVLLHEEAVVPTASHVRQIIRSNYSSPPLHGARIIKTILNSPRLKQQWQEEVTLMRTRINIMRSDLEQGLQSQLPHRDFHFLNQQKGFFSYCGLNPDHVSHLRHDWGIYLPPDGRLNIAGLNTHHMNYVIDAFTSVLTQP